MNYSLTIEVRRTGLMRYSKLAIHGWFWVQCTLLQILSDFFSGISRIFCLGPNPSYNFIIEGCQKIITHNNPPPSVLWLEIMNHHRCVLSWHMTKNNRLLSSQDYLDTRWCQWRYKLDFHSEYWQKKLHKMIFMQHTIYKKALKCKKTRLSAWTLIVCSYLNSQGQTVPGSPPPCS